MSGPLGRASRFLHFLLPLKLFDKSERKKGKFLELNHTKRWNSEALRCQSGRLRHFSTKTFVTWWYFGNLGVKRHFHNMFFPKTFVNQTTRSSRSSLWFLYCAMSNFAHDCIDVNAHSFRLVLRCSETVSPSVTCDFRHLDWPKDHFILFVGARGTFKAILSQFFVTWNKPLNTCVSLLFFYPRRSRIKVFDVLTWSFPVHFWKSRLNLSLFIRALHLSSTKLSTLQFATCIGAHREPLRWSGIRLFVAK